MNDIAEIEELKTIILLKKNDERIIGIDASEIDEKSVSQISPIKKSPKNTRNSELREIYNSDRKLQNNDWAIDEFFNEFSDNMNKSFHYKREKNTGGHAS